MIYGLHRNKYYLCFFHSLGLYLTSSSYSFSELVKDKADGGNGSTYINWMFPELQTVNSGGISRKVDLIIKALAKEVESLNDDMAPHGLKAGVLDDMFINHTCPHIGIIQCGGFNSAEYTSTAYRYAAMKSGVVEAGHALNDYNKVQVQVPVPNYDLVITQVSFCVCFKYSDKAYSHIIYCLEFSLIVSDLVI